MENEKIECTNIIEELLHEVYKNEDIYDCNFNNLIWSYGSNRTKIKNLEDSHLSSLYVFIPRNDYKNCNFLYFYAVCKELSKRNLTPKSSSFQYELSCILKILNSKFLNIENLKFEISHIQKRKSLTLFFIEFLKAESNIIEEYLKSKELKIKKEPRSEFANTTERKYFYLT